jgi:hypothetical protein
MPLTDPATDRQYAYLTTLLGERDAAVTGVPDVPALVAALRAKPASKGDVSKLIDAVKALPKSAAPAIQAAVSHRSNNYGGECRDCGLYVTAGTGKIERKANGRGWDTLHLVCPVIPDHGLYLHTDGRIFKVYTGQQSRRTQVDVLRDLGDGTGAFDYVKNGVVLLAAMVEAGEVRLLTQDEAAAFGRTHGFCVNCGRRIEVDRSLAAGYGPKCAANNGWWYPTRDEAAEILGRPVGLADDDESGEV